MIENRQLRYFIAAAHELHITRAAESLHIAQPALTQNIRQLEAELGVTLFHRIRKRISLTEAGHLFLAEAERSLNHLELAVRSVQKTARGELGKLAIGFTSMAGLILVPKLVSEFRKRYPGPMIVLREMGAADQEDALRSESIDLGISYGPPKVGEFSLRQLQPDRLIAALPRAHRLARKARIDLGDLASDRFILPSQETAGALAGAVFEECRHAGFQPETGHEIITATVQTTLGLVSAGLGVSLLPGAAQPFYRKGVAFRPLVSPKVVISLKVQWRSRDTSPVLQNLLALLS
jgi:DNA-binding transcriptional LysR family regulator